MKSYQFKVCAAPIDDIGRDRIRIKRSRRLNTKRFTIISVRSGAVSALVCALGHEAADDVVQMDIDLREKFNVGIGDTISLQISEAGWIGTLIWYFMARDPAIRVPALLGAWSLFLAVISLLVPLLQWAV